MSDTQQYWASARRHFSGEWAVMTFYERFEQTLLIAMEFKHSIIRVALRRDSIIQVKTVVLIALIAVSRKFVILDTATTEAPKIAALAAALLALGEVNWVLRERDERPLELSSGRHTSLAEGKSHHEL